MNYYDKLVLVCSVPVFVVLGWRWKPVRPLMVGIAALSLLAIQIYHGDLSRANNPFSQNFFWGSQSAILWMSALFVFATVFYWISLLSRSPTGAAIGSENSQVPGRVGFTGPEV